MTNSNKYRNSTFFLQQKRLAIQKNLEQLQKSSITRDFIRSKDIHSIIQSVYRVCIRFLLKKVFKQKIIRLKTIVSIHF